MSRLLAPALALAAVLAASGAALADKDETTLVSRQSGADGGAGADGMFPALTSATRTVAVGRHRRKVTKAGSVKMKLRLKGRGKRTLRRKHKLRVTVKSTFKPEGGGKAITAKKPVTFKLKR